MICAFGERCGPNNEVRFGKVDVAAEAPRMVWTRVSPRSIFVG
jgi:hypothetical protein